MTGQITETAGSDFAALRLFTHDVPDATNLSALFWLNTDLATAQTNNGFGPNATGSPSRATVNANNTSFTGSTSNANGYFATSEADNASNDLTLMMVARISDPTDFCPLWGVHDSTVNGGAALRHDGFMVSNGSTRFVAEWPDHVPTGTGDFVFRAGVYRQNAGGTAGISRVFAGWKGDLIEGRNRDVLRLQNTATARIGGGHAGGSANDPDRALAMAAKVQRALTPDEVAQWYGFCRTYLLRISTPLAIG